MTLSLRACVPVFFTGEMQFIDSMRYHTLTGLDDSFLGQTVRHCPAGSFPYVNDFPRRFTAANLSAGLKYSVRTLPFVCTSTLVLNTDLAVACIRRIFDPDDRGYHT